MNFKNISDHDLHRKTITAASNEKAATLVLFEYLHEVDQRRLYAARGFTSLWEYVHVALGYSESQTSERVNTMRLAFRVPQVKEKLLDGTLSLTSAAKLASFERRQNLNPEQTVVFLEKIANMPTREVERVFVVDGKLSRPDRIRAVSSETIQITFDADAEFMALLNRVKEIQGNPSVRLEDLFKTALKEYVGRKAAKYEKNKVTAPNTQLLRAPEVRNRVARPIRKRREHRPTRYIPVKIRNEVRIRSNDQCEFVDSITNRRCSGRTGLEFDHRVPFALGGRHSLENIRHYCPAHNKFAAIKVFGREKMNRYLKL